MIQEVLAVDLRRRIEQDLVSAQKKQDKVRLETLRFLLSAIKYREVDKKTELSDPEVLEVITKQVKTHEESIEAFKKGGRVDLVAKEQAELKILESYLPPRLSEQEIREQVIKKLSELRNNGQTVDFGLVMKSAMPALKGQADGVTVKKMVEEVLKGK